MDLISACANHMNSPLSYIDPANVASVKVFAGITPVSVGGDSIGGTIQVDSATPQFAQAGEGTLINGQVGAFYRSNNAAQGGNISAVIAAEDLYVRYTGSTVRAKNYTAAQSFKAAGIATGTSAFLAGNEVGSSMYQSNNQALDFGLRHENHLFELKLGLQSIPYQGFANQRMDMLKNDSKQINLSYKGQYDWGTLHARAYNEHTQHYMNFLADKLQITNPAGMPMSTDGKNTGFSVKGEVVLSERDILRIGTEYQRYRMSDWWSPISAVVANPQMGMKGTTYWNINNGQRDRLAVFGEWEAKWNQQWLSQLGLRSESVKMNTGAVQGYNTTSYPAASYAAFNAANRQSTDNNIDLTALARYTPDDHKSFEFGFAQKTRSPNLYERFAWSANNTMVLNMNNWVGDGNGYVGNLNLKPEVARTLSVSGDWHDAAQEDWDLKLAPYYTHVQNYIDAVACTATATHAACPARADGFANLSLTNQTARMYGADVSGKLSLVKTSEYGSFNATGVLSYVNGKNLTTGGNLYNIMPLNMKLAVEQRSGNWTNSIEARLVNAKTNVEAVRKELRTGGYGLLNLYTSYEWKQMRFDLGVENLLNKFYVNPLGGAYVGQGNTMGATAPYGIVVPGMGRSINAGMTVKF
jgi:iron complex outermembrane receptor protein